MLAWKPYKILNCVLGVIYKPIYTYEGYNITILFMKIQQRGYGNKAKK